MKKVLIVDDSKYYRDMIREILEKHNYELYEAENGLDAYNKYFKIKPDIVTMDIDMPLQDGLETTRKIFLEDKNANIMMCSTLMSVRYYIDLAYKYGAKQIISKPFNEIEFNMKLAELLDIMED